MASTSGSRSTDATFAALEAALVEHKVVFLRDQHLTTAEHVAFGRRFGELEVHPFRPEGEFPEIMVLDNHKDNPVLSTDVWHSDTTFRECPTRYSILRCLQIPAVGGDTLWADMCAAYDGLSDTMKGLIDGLEAIHDFQNFRRLFTRSEADQAKLRRMEELYPNPTHPVVRTHPMTGRRILFVNPQFTIRIKGMKEARAGRCWNSCIPRRRCRNTSSACAGSRARSCCGTTPRPSTMPPTTTTPTGATWSASP